MPNMRPIIQSHESFAKAYEGDASANGPSSAVPDMRKIHIKSKSSGYPYQAHAQLSDSKVSSVLQSIQTAQWGEGKCNDSISAAVEYVSNRLIVFCRRTWQLIPKTTRISAPIARKRSDTIRVCSNITITCIQMNGKPIERHESLPHKNPAEKEDFNSPFCCNNDFCRKNIFNK